MNSDPRATAQWLAAFRAQHGIETAMADGSLAEQRARSAAAYAERNVPPRFASALPTVPEVLAWVAEVSQRAIHGSHARGLMSPVVQDGPSLLITGPTGVGKTFEAYGAVRVLNLLGIHARWQVVTAADLYARLRPRYGIDQEEEFRAIADADVLVIDDLGAAKHSDWVEETNLRLVNRRYDLARPTVFTSNHPPAQLAQVLDDRVASRVREITRKVAIKGEDRRRSGR